MYYDTTTNPFNFFHFGNFESNNCFGRVTLNRVEFNGIFYNTDRPYVKYHNDVRSVVQTAFSATNMLRIVSINYNFGRL